MASIDIIDSDDMGPDGFTLTLSSLDPVDMALMALIDVAEDRMDDAEKRDMAVDLAEQYGRDDPEALYQEIDDAVAKLRSVMFA